MRQLPPSFDFLLSSAGSDSRNMTLMRRGELIFGRAEARSLRLEQSISPSTCRIVDLARRTKPCIGEDGETIIWLIAKKMSG